MSHLQVLQSLRPVSLGPTDEALTAVDATILDGILSSLRRLEPEIFPATSSLLLRFEQILGLANSGTEIERRKAIQAKLSSVGGISAPFFISLAASIGFTVQIMPNPRMFRAGLSCAGDPVYSMDGENSPWRWNVKVLDRDDNRSDSMLMALFDELKPPDTEINWSFDTQISEGDGLLASAYSTIDEGDGALSGSFPVIDEGAGVAYV